MTELQVSTKLAEITRAIHYHEEQARQAARLALQHKITIGGKLAEARRLLGRDDFRRWAEREFGWTPRHLRTHLRLWMERKRVSALPPGSSLRRALAALKTEQKPKALAVPSEIRPPEVASGEGLPGSEGGQAPSEVDVEGWQKLSFSIPEIEITPGVALEITLDLEATPDSEGKVPLKLRAVPAEPPATVTPATGGQAAAGTATPPEDP